MSKTNVTSYGAAATSERELTIDELDAVVGGTDPRIIDEAYKTAVAIFESWMAPVKEAVRASS